MGEFTGVDPLRLRELANALRGLADTLQTEGGTIRDLFSKWEGTLNQAPLTQQTTQVGDDARNMALRASLAYSLLLQPRYVDPNSPHKDWVSIPWDVTKIDTKTEGQREALSLLKALNSPDDPQSRTTIQLLSQSLADHADDPAYLQAFMNAGGLDASVRAARVLHGQDGTHGEKVLSQESEQILSRFGQALQTATSLAEQGKIQLLPNYMQKLTHPPGGDMWSVGMLFKYGPKGDKWDPKVLSTVGGAMLDWRSKQEMRPSYTPSQVIPGARYGYIPGGYAGDENAWYQSLGLKVSGITLNADDVAASLRGITANDPSIALMQRVSENGDASRQLLTGPDGSRHAKTLVDNKWQTPGPQPLDDAKWPAAVITAATMDRTGHPKESAEAAANVINAGSTEYGDEGKTSAYEKEQYPGLPPGITRALSQVFAAYVPDFAQSHRMPNQPAAPATGGEENVGTLIVGQPTSLNFLGLIMKNNKDESGNVVNAVNSQISVAAALGLDRPEAQTYLKNLAELQGVVTATAERNGLKEAQLKDEANKKSLLWANTVTGAIGAIPGLPDAGQWIQAAIAGGMPAVRESYSTDNAAKYEQQAKTTSFEAQSAMRLPLLRGLVASGQIKPPSNHPEWANGQIQIQSQQDVTDLNSWWKIVAPQQGGRLDNFDDEMATAFNRGQTAN
ncbi:hypothetical protein ACTWQF_08925 [Streptomyces sp. 8N114]|uniref:hypothetical protein n=1 Tax=Streptomyces sp. 8N114 TaxID=3457419 RepID=UPI003FD20466